MHSQVFCFPALLYIMSVSHTHESTHLPSTVLQVQFNATLRLFPALDHGTPQSGSIRRTFSTHSSGRCHLYPVCTPTLHTEYSYPVQKKYDPVSTSSRFYSPRSLSPNPHPIPNLSANRSNPPSQQAASRLTAAHGTGQKHRAHRSGQHTDWTS